MFKFRNNRYYYNRWKQTSFYQRRYQSNHDTPDKGKYQDIHLSGPSSDKPSFKNLKKINLIPDRKVKLNYGRYLSFNRMVKITWQSIREQQPGSSQPRHW